MTALSIPERAREIPERLHVGRFTRIAAWLISKTLRNVEEMKNGK